MVTKFVDGFSHLKRHTHTYTYIYIYASPPPQGPPFKIKSCVFLLLNKIYILYKIVYIYIYIIIFSTPQTSNSMKFIIKNIYNIFIKNHIINVIYIVFIIYLLISKSILLILWIIYYIHIIKILNIILLSIFWITINILSNISDDIKTILIWFSLKI